jgi:hypothetical protein
MVPSLCGHMALVDIADLTHGRGTLLEIGSGYGRDLSLFKTFFNEIRMNCVEPASTTRVVTQEMLRPNTSLSHCWEVDVLELRVLALYDIIYSNYVLHLFSRSEVLAVLRGCYSMLTTTGAVIMSFVSTEDIHYGVGRKIAEDCYEVTQGIPWSFWSKDAILSVLREAGLTVHTLRPYREIELVKGEIDAVSAWYVVATLPRRSV